MERDLRMEYERGDISTTSPQKMTAEDIKNHLVYRKELGKEYGFGADEYRHEVAALNALFDFIGNNAVHSCLRKYPGIRPHESKEKLPTFTKEEFEGVLDFYENLDLDSLDDKMIVPMPSSLCFSDAA